MFRWRVILLAALLLVLLSQPVLAQSGSGGRVLFGQNLTIKSGERLDGDVVVFGGSVTIEPDGQVRGSVVCFGGSIVSSGRIEGGAYSFGGSVDLREGAVVDGDALATGGVNLNHDAVVRGEIVGGFGWTAVPSPVIVQVRSRPAWRPVWPFRAVGDFFNWAWDTLLGTLTMLVLGIVVVLLVPGLTRTTGQSLLAYPAQSAGVGLLTWLAAALALPILVIICIGIPVAVLGAVGLVIAATFGWIAAALILGERLLEAFRLVERPPVLAVAVGVLALAVLSAMPCLGWLVSVIVATCGLGAVVLSRFGTVAYAPVPAAAPVAPVLPAPPEPPAEGPGPEA